MQYKSIRGATVSRFLLAGSLLASTAQFAHAQEMLRIQRGPGGIVEQEIAITSATYSAKVRQLIVTSASGGRVCGNAQSKSAGSAGVLVLDGRRYALDQHDFGDSSKVIRVSPQTSSGLFPICVNQVAPKGSAPLKLNVNVATNPDAGMGSRSVVNVLGSEVDYTLSNGMLTLPLSEDVLCLSVGAGTGEPTLNLVDTNGQGRQFSGISDLAFYPFGGAFPANSMVLNTSDDLVCVGLSSPPAKVNSKFDEACQLVPLPAPIFHSGFGDDRVEPPPDLAPGVDLQVNVRLDQNPTLPVSVGGTQEPAIYRVEVRNCGQTSASSVSVRDFWRPQDVATEPRFNQSSTWQCASCSGGFGTGSGYVEAYQQSLSSLETKVFVATRALDAGAGVLEDEIIEMTVAAFAGPNDAVEYSPDNNTQSFPIPVLRTNNTPPTAVRNYLPDPVDEVDPVEDGLPPLIELIEIVTASDIDDGLFGEIVDVDVTTDRPDIFSAAGALLKNGNDVTVTLRPIGDAYGTANISVVVIDGAGDASQPVTFGIWIRRVNDAPSFSVYQFDRNLPGLVDTSLPVCEPTGVPGSDCADQVWIAGQLANDGNIVLDNWIASQSVGPANENETLSFETVLVDDPDGIFIGPGFYPEVDGKGNLRYGLRDPVSGDPVTGVATVQIRAKDGGGTLRGGIDTSEVLEFQISIQ